jgi:hypothetical protein
VSLPCLPNFILDTNMTGGTTDTSCGPAVVVILRLRHPQSPVSLQTTSFCHPESSSCSPMGPQSGLHAFPRVVPTSCGVGTRLGLVLGASGVARNAHFVISPQFVQGQVGCHRTPFSARQVLAKHVVDIALPRGIGRNRLWHAMT